MGSFLLLNALLLLWLLTFVALSLLGSTLGKSTVAAGGIGLGLCVVLMLLGTLPRWGALLPGGLMTWATLLGQKAAGLSPGADAASLAQRRGSRAGRRRRLRPGDHPAQPGAGSRNLEQQEI